MMTLIDRLKAARRVAVPLININTPDPAETIRLCRDAFDPKDAKTPIPLIRWDSMNGYTGLNAAGSESVAALFGKDVEPEEWAALTTNPGAALSMLPKFPGERRDEQGNLVSRGAIVFMLNLRRYFEDESGRSNGQVVQGIWNVRDEFKADRRTLITLGPSATLPAELAQDVISFDEPYPADEKLAAIVGEQAEAAEAKLEPKVVEGAVVALRGMSAFTAEQITAMSLLDSLDLDELWSRSIQIIEQTPGLSVDRGAETFDDVRGLSNFKKFGLALIRSEYAPTVYIRVDEIEKYLGGLGQNGGAADNTGVSQDRLGVLLREMEDRGHTGFVCLGHAGCGKSLITKAMANTATQTTGRRVLSIAMDLGAMSNSALGKSEERIRQAMKVIAALAAGGRACFMATCNSIEVLPPALKRRFKLGTWMFDLPDAADKKAQWQYHMEKMAIKPQPVPNDENFTGADIRNVCDVARTLGVSLKEAMNYVTLVAQSDPEAIGRLRKFAHGKLIDASHPGTYRNPFDVAVRTPDQPDAAPRRARGREE